MADAVKRGFEDKALRRKFSHVLDSHGHKWIAHTTGNSLKVKITRHIALMLSVAMIVTLEHKRPPPPAANTCLREQRLAAREVAGLLFEARVFEPRLRGQRLHRVHAGIPGRGVKGRGREQGWGEWRE